MSVNSLLMFCTICGGRAYIVTDFGTNQAYSVCDVCDTVFELPPDIARIEIERAASRANLVGAK